MCRTLVESKSGSYAGKIVPPGIPKTISTPTASSERTNDCAPVILSGVPTGGAGLGAATPGGFGSAGVVSKARPSLVSDLEVALVIGSASLVSVLVMLAFVLIWSYLCSSGVVIAVILGMDNKKPPPTERSHEGRASTRLGYP